MKHRRWVWLVGAAVFITAIYLVNAALKATADNAHADIVRIYELAKRGDYDLIRKVATPYTADNLEWFERDYGKVERFQFAWSKAQLWPGYGAASGRVWRRGKPYSVSASIQSNRVYHLYEFEATDSQ